MAEIIASGDWWTLDRDGTLDIFIEGAMPDYDYFHYSNTPWYEQRFRIQTVIIRNGLTHIGRYAFYYCTNLTSVTIPDSVTHIGAAALGYCVALSSIAIPGSVTRINGATFYNCASLAEITIPGSIGTIEAGAFEGCGIVHVYYRGFEYDWQNIDNRDDTLSRAMLHYRPTVLHVGGALDNGRIHGAQFTFAPGEYVELSYVQSASMDGNEVQSDELYAELRVAGNPETWLSGWEGVSRTVPVWFTRYGQIDGHDTVSVIERREKYYFKSLERVARQNFLLTAQSPIGRLTSDFPGGMYEGEPLYDILSAVTGDVPKTIDYRLNNIGVYGWAPYQSRRETLHMLALACGFVVRRDWKYDLYFTLPDTGAGELPDGVIFHGGAVDYRIGTAYAGAEVSEYTFLRTPNDKEVTLFDNTDGSDVADGLTVVFSDAPVYGLTASGALTVDRANVNAAVVSGVGVLTGKAYTVVTGMTYLSAENDADPEQVLSIRDIPLITNLNAETVARKFLSSANAPVVEMDFLRQRQRPGDLFAFADPYGAPRTGYLLSMSGSLTSLERVTGTFLSGYVPVWGNTYSAVTVLNGVGEWTVPDSLDGTTVRVVLIGGGTGGASGQRGSDATASGGGHGTPGDGGKVYVVRLTVHAGESYGYRCGAGGPGGAPSADYDTDEDEDEKTYRNNPGTAGGASVFELTQGGVVVGQWTSDDGEATAVGYSDMIDGTQYAAPGPDSGQDGGGAASGREDGNRNAPGYTDTEFPTLSLPLDEFRNWTYNGQIYDAETWTSGSPGAGKFASQNGGEFQEWAYGGLGGGAAVGSDGGDGAEASNTYTGGAGGKGADALPVFPEDTRAYGSGGSGGHGGGEAVSAAPGTRRSRAASRYTGRAARAVPAPAGRTGKPDVF
ncbi:MAG: leucine-rich repeat domain-containing protein [Oscillibacter sp.]|nr:leucine-rich repeat domain-containing protein [Oscillibacter sp.]